MTTDIPAISIVIPTRNEEDNALQIAAAVIAQIEPIEPNFDVIFIDNASDDRTVELLRGLCARDPRVRLIINARNFGQMRSPTHGIFQARGRAIINMCADFQDPPELIPHFVQRWREGADIVLGVRQSERSSRRLGIVRRLSYWLAATFADYPLIPNATGFGIYDRRVVDVIRALKEPEPFFRGMLVETGYDIETIPYARPERAGGRSNNNFFALLDFALSGLTSSSKRLLRLPLHLGAVAALVAVGMLVMGVVFGIFGGRMWPWLLAALIQINFAALLGFLGMFGDQMRMLVERTRQTPLVIERERINFTDGY